MNDDTYTSIKTSAGVTVNRVFFTKEKPYFVFEVHYNRIHEQRKEIYVVADTQDEKVGKIGCRIPTDKKHTNHLKVFPYPLVERGEERNPKAKVLSAVFLKVIVDDWRPGLFQKQKEDIYNEEWFDKWFALRANNPASCAPFDLFAGFFDEKNMGTRKETPSGSQPCSECNGTGFITTQNNLLIAKTYITTECPHCRGKGYI